MRVLLCDLSWRWGGADLRVLQLAKGLPDAEIRVAVIEGSETESRLASEGVSLLRLRRGRKDPRILFDLARAMRRYQPDVVDAHNAQSILWGLPAARLAGVERRVATIHSMFEQSDRRRFGRVLFGALYRVMGAAATDVIAVSQVVAEHLSDQGVARRPVRVIRNGIEIPPQTAQSDGVGAPREAGGRLQIVTVGRLNPVKGQATLVEAVGRLVAEGRDIGCWIVGEGPERAALEEQIRRLDLEDRVKLLGFKRHVDPILAESDVFCLPSLTEGLPFAALEASAQGKPIVASRVGGLARHFSHQESALLTPPGDVEALAAALRQCAADRAFAAALGRRARRMVERDYSLDLTLAETRTLYRLGAGGAAPAAGRGLEESA